MNGKIRILFIALNVFLSVCFIKSQTVTVTVDAKKEIGRVNPLLYGINVARWDEGIFPDSTKDMLLTCDRDAIRKVREGGFTLLKYPGGNDADHYVWNDPNNSAGEMDTDEYAAFLKAVGAEGFITVNFNESPTLAAEWVRYCNKEKGYNIKYWEVGDEQWGTWARGHTTPEKYAERFIEFVKAMKAVDSTISVAANVKPSDDPNDWTYRVLKTAGKYIDMVTFTFYPLPNTNENEDSLLTSTTRFRHEYMTIRNVLRATLPEEKADTMWIINVGYNSISGYPGPITLSIANALWTADILGTMAELGTQVACFWALHNAYPPRGGDYGVLSADGRNIPSYSYYVFPLYTHLFGKILVESLSSDPNVSVYASRFGDDTLSVIFINKDRRNDKELRVSLRSFDPSPTGRIWIVDAKRKLQRLPGTQIRIGQTNFSLHLPKYSIVAVQLLRAGAILPPVNIALHARASASSYSLTDPYFGPQSAVDGKLHTRWASAAWASKDGSDQQWFQIDLGIPKTFNRIVIRWAKGYGTEYTIAVSVDGKRWNDVLKQSNGKGKVEQLDFNPVTARYIRLHGTKGSKAISTYSIYEFEVYNTHERRSF